MLETSIRRDKSSLRQMISIMPTAITIVFVLVALLTMPGAKRFFAFASVRDALAGIKAENIVEIMGWEHPSFGQDLPRDYEKISFTKLALRAATHINFEDERSLLGNELPGFTVFDTEIVVAGEGTNYTNVPIESPPPLDYILERQKEEGAGVDKSKKTPPRAAAKNAQVFLYSTHSWESYLPLLGKAGAQNANLATSAKTNIHLVDEMLKNALAKYGVQATIDETNISTVLKEKNWGTEKAYNASRPIVQQAIAGNHGYLLIIDIHRDSARKPQTTATIHGHSYARVSIVIGKGNPYSDQNELIAKKLNAKMNKDYPGLSKGIFLKSRAEGNGVYNQDLSPHVLLFEIGGVDNTKEELERTVNALADVLSDYVKNAEKV